MKPKKHKAAGEALARTTAKARDSKTPRSIEMRAPPEKTTNTSKKVFNTVELLEAILVRLPAKDIFRSQMVCRQFRDVVISSTQIKRKLFYITSNPEESWDFCADRPIDPHLHFPEAKYHLVPQHEKNTNIIRASLTPTSLCPLLNIDVGDVWRNSNVLHRLGHNEQSAQAAFMVRDSHRTRGSWRKMQLSDPPCRSAVIDRARVKITDLPNPRDALINDVRLEDASGITLGKLVDALCTTTKTRFFDGNMGRRGLLGAGSLDELREEFKAERAGSDDLEIWCLYVELEGMIVPLDDERAGMKEKGVLRGA